MKMVKTLKVKYPTLQYHGADLFCSVEITDEDLTEREKSAPLVQKSELMGRYIDHILSTEFLRMRDIAETYMSPKFYSITSNHNAGTQQTAIRRGLK